jgi:hypothetical protein
MPSIPEATDSICECFNTAWANRTAIEWPNVASATGTKLSEGNDAYVSFHVIHESSDQLSLGETGNRVFTREGQFIAQIFVPVAKRGLDESTLLAKAALDAFEGITFGGVRFHQVGAKTVGPQGNWFQVNVSGNFEFDEVK